MKIGPGTLTHISQLFQENFRERGELGAAVSIWQDGESILELQGGFCDAQRDHPWTNDTVVLIWSATKGLGSACLLHALQEKSLELSLPVSKLWPEFGQADKAAITIAQLVSHQAGLSALDDSIDVLDYEAVIKALERQAPIWPPGAEHGYHARTFGFLIDELVRRVAGETISQYWRRVFAEPLGLQIWIGLPSGVNDRVATVYAAKLGHALPTPPRFYEELTTPGTLVRRTFTSPRGLHAVSAMNRPEIRSHSIVSFGGIGNARSLAKFYALLAHGGELEGKRIIQPSTLAWMTTPLSSGADRVFQIPTCFSAGFMKNAAGQTIFGPSRSAFGHPGAGGSHAFADPENGIAFAYVMNQMQQSLLPNEKSIRLVDALYETAKK